MELDQIKRTLRALGKTQGELAAHLGVDESFVSKLLNGKARMPLATYRKIEAFLADAPARGVREQAAPYALDDFVLPSAPRPKPSPAEAARIMADILDLGAAMRALPRESDLSDDELLGYGEHGA